MRRLLLAPALALVLTACAGGDPVDERRSAVADVTDAANAGDAEGVLDAVEDLLSVLRRQVASGDLDRAEADRLRVLAERVAANAALVEPAPAPSPEPTEEPSPEPTEEEPSPEPTEEEPSPEPTEEEEPSPEPTEEEEPPVVVTVPPAEPSPTAAQVTPAAQRPASPSPTTAAPSPQPTA